MTARVNAALFKAVLRPATLGTAEATPAAISLSLSICTSGAVPACK